MTVVAAVLLCLSGCSADESNGSYAYGVEMSDLLGEWQSSEPLEVKLILNSDGSFESSSWRDYLTCPPDNSRSVEDLSSDPAVALSGTWAVNPGKPVGALPSVSLTVPGSECSDGGVISYVWRDQSGALSVCFPLGRILDPDNFVSTKTVILTRPNVSEDTGRACFN